MDDQKVVLVTGGSSGIGQATALEYAKLGYKVAITGRDQERLQKVVECMVASSPDKSQDSFLTLQANFEDPAQVEPIVAHTVAKFGKLDILVNNAGYLSMMHDFNHPDFFEDFQRVLQVNLMAATRIAQLASPHILKTKGVIINVTSIADRLPVSVSYSVSKAGLSMLTKTLAQAFDGSGVRVVGLAAGPIITNIFGHTIPPGTHCPFTLAHRFGEAKEVADTILFLTSDKASFINGSTIDVDGGLMIKLCSTISLARK